MGHDDTLGNSGAAAGVHDDGRVRGVRWSFTLGGRGPGGENGREFVEGDCLSVVRQRLVFVAEMVEVHFWYRLEGVNNFVVGVINLVDANKVSTDM